MNHLIQASYTVIIIIIMNVISSCHHMMTTIVSSIMFIHNVGNVTQGILTINSIVVIITIICIVHIMITCIAIVISTSDWIIMLILMLMNMYYN